MKTDIIQEFLSSSDLDTRYLGVSMLRHNSDLDSLKSNRELIKSVPILDRIKTIEDIYFEAEVNEEDIIIFKNPKNKKERYINACNIIPIISQVLNEGWIPDYLDTDECKYYPYFIRRSSGWLLGDSLYDLVNSRMGFGFTYKTKELSDFAGKTFLKYYIDYLPE